MTSVLSTLSALITPDMISGLGKQLGLSDELTRQGVAISSAVLTGGMARAASTPEGAAAVADMVGKADSSLLGNITGAVSAALAGTDNTASQLFGSNLELVTSGVKKATGIDIGPMIGLAAPVVLAVTKNIVTQQNLDADGIAKLLQGEVRGLSRRDAATAQVLKEVFKPLEAQDKLRAAYSDEEWAALQQAPLNAAALVMLADRSGGGGRRQEVEALQSALAASASAAGPAELVSLLFRDGVSGAAVEDLVKTYRKADEEERKQALLAPITQAVTIVKSKAARGDATAYQGLLIAATQKVASAAKEGGFLGMGGVDVSDDEKLAIDAVAAAVSAA